MRKNFGFTLLELLVVLIILTIALAIIMPRLGNNDQRILKSYTQRILSLLKFARYQAIFTNKEVEVVLDNNKFLIPQLKKKLSISQDLKVRLSISSSGQTIYFFPSGTSIPFGICLQKNNSFRYITFNSANSTFTIQDECPFQTK